MEEIIKCNRLFGDGHKKVWPVSNRSDRFDIKN